MATATTIQYLGTTDAVTGAQLGVSPSDRRQVETFLFTNPNAPGGATINLVAGEVAALDVSKMVTDPTGGLTSVSVVTAIAPNQIVSVGCFAESKAVLPQQTVPVKVVVRGPVTNVPSAGAIPVGAEVVIDPLLGLGTVAAKTALGEHSIGVALTAAPGPGAGFVSVYVWGSGI